MRIISIDITPNPESHVPEMIVKLAMPMALTKTVETVEEQETMLGRAMMAAFKEYTKNWDN